MDRAWIARALTGQAAIGVILGPAAHAPRAYGHARSPPWPAQCRPHLANLELSAAQAMGPFFS
jgi:hypothetical protein